MLLETNDKVQVLPHTTFRSIFNNSESVVPLEVEHEGGQIGYIQYFEGGEDGWPETATLTSRPNGKGKYIGDWLTKNLTKIK